MDKEQKIKELLDRLNALDNPKNLSDIKFLDVINSKLDSFKTTFDLKPVTDSVNKFQDELQFVKDTVSKEFNKTNKNYEGKLAEIGTHIQNTAISSESSTNSKISPLLKDLTSLQQNFTSNLESSKQKESSLNILISGIQNNLQELADNLTKSKKENGSLKTSVEKSNKTLIADFEDKINSLKSELANRIVNAGGGDKGTKITINTSVLSTKYKDINFKGTSGITYSAADNNTTKMVDLSITNLGDITSANLLGTASQINLSASGVGVLVGSTNITLSLASTITAGGPTGSATVTPIITYDALGRLTTVSSATITPAASSITGTSNLIGTSNQVILSASGTGALVGGNSITLSLPQSIATSSAVSFASLATSAVSPLLLTNGQLVTIALTSQTVGGTTLTIPNFASISDIFTFNTLAATLLNKTLDTSVGKGTWTASGTWTLPALTLGGTVSGGGNQINNIIIGTVTPLAGTFTTLTANTSLVINAGTALTTTNQTGTGSLVLATSPTITTPTITTSATGPLYIGGTTTTSTLTLRSTSGVGAAGADIIFQTGNNGATEAMRILNNGNVGIGTTAPLFPLHVAGTGQTVVLERNSANTGGPVINSYKSRNTVSNPTNISSGDDLFSIRVTPYINNAYNDIGQQILVGSDGAASGNFMPTYVAIRTSTSSAASIERMRIDSAGNVGIGTAAPTKLLHLNSSTNGAEVSIGFAAKDSGGTSRSMTVGLGVVADNAFSIGSTFAIQPSTGNVGIGTTSPTSLLHISAAAPRINITATTGTNAAFFNLNNTGGSSYIGIENSAGNGLVSVGGLAYALAIVGPTSDSYALQFATGASNTARMTILGNGSVGIGTTAPGALLSVAEKLQVNSSGLIPKYNNISTVSNGVPSEVATIDTTGLTANVAASTLYAVPASGVGMYRVSAYLVTTTAASVSSTMPNAQVVYTDSDSNTSVTLDISPILGAAGLGQSGLLTANAIGTVFTGVAVIYVKASTTIQYQTVNYASTAAGMAYALRIKLESL